MDLITGARKYLDIRKGMDMSVGEYLEFCNELVAMEKNVVCLGLDDCKTIWFFSPGVLKTYKEDIDLHCEGASDALVWLDDDMILLNMGDNWSIGLFCICSRDFYAQFSNCRMRYNYSFCMTKLAYVRQNGIFLRAAESDIDDIQKRIDFVQESLFKKINSGISATKT